MQRVGSFSTTSGRLRITDPCYDRSTWCAGVVDNCSKGEWEAFTEKREVEGWGNRNALLLVRSKDKTAVSDWELLNIEVGVDAGMAGVFDEDLFKTKLKTPVKLTGRKEYDRKRWEHLVKEAESLKDDSNFLVKGLFNRRHEEAVERLKEFDAEPAKISSDFYDVCCSLTFSNVGAGTLEYGAVSSSGFGDGSYAAYARKTITGEVAEIKIVFMDDEKSDEEFDYEDEPREGTGTFFLGGKL